MIDYGAIAWKNGKLISTEMFTPMKDMVGWDDSNFNYKNPLVDEYFAYVGDECFTIAFYKSVMRIYSPKYAYDNKTVCFGVERFEGWEKWTFYSMANHKDIEIIVKPKRFHNYYVCYFKYGKDKYKVAFGYGVDLEYYKKTHIIDYYGTPWYKIKRAWRNFKYWRRF